MKFFRGEAAAVWVRRLVLRGWPEEMAYPMARFLVGETATPPKWPEALELPGTTRKRPDRPRERS